MNRSMNRSRIFSVVSLFTLALLAAAAPARAADTYKVDPVHSIVIFRVNHLGSSWSYGRFDQSSGTFTVDESKPEDVKFDITVDTNSMDTNNEKRDTHLKSADFFSVKEFPTMTFKSTSTKAVGEKKYEVTGDLTLHGVTKSITVPIEFVGTSNFPQAGPRAGYEAQLSVKRSDFGMGKMIPMAGDEIHVTVSLEGVKQ